MNCWKWLEFYTDDETDLLSMNRLCTFIATSSIMVAFINSAFKNYDNTATLAAILAGLGGFSYAAGRMTGAYTQVRLKQAENGIPAPDVTPQQPAPTTINIGSKPDATVPARVVRKR